MAILGRGGQHVRGGERASDGHGKRCAGARIGFACLAAHNIKIYTYRNGAVKELLEHAGMSQWPLAKVMEGEPAAAVTFGERDAALIGDAAIASATAFCLAPGEKSGLASVDHPPPFDSGRRAGDIQYTPRSWR